MGDCRICTENKVCVHRAQVVLQLRRSMGVSCFMHEELGILFLSPMPYFYANSFRVRFWHYCQGR